MRLLIVDDEEATCQGMRVRVQSMNLPALTDIDLAFSAEEALALAQKKEVLLLLTDIKKAKSLSVQRNHDRPSAV